MLHVFAFLTLLAGSFGCSPGSVSIQETERKKELVPSPPDPATWSLNLFKEKWNSAPSTVEQALVLANLKVRAAANFPWKEMWIEFGSGGIRFPSEYQTPLHSEILSLHKFSCDQESFDAYSAYVLKIIESDKYPSLNHIYFKSAFGSARLCGTVSASPALSTRAMNWALKAFPFDPRTNETEQDAIYSDIVSATENLERSLRLYEGPRTQLAAAFDQVDHEKLKYFSESIVLEPRRTALTARLLKSASAMGQLGKLAEKTYGAVVVAAMAGKETFRDWVHTCAINADCNRSEIVQIWNEQPDYYFAKRSPAELLSLLEVVLDELIENAQPKTNANFEQVFTDVSGLMAMTGRVEKFISDSKGPTLLLLRAFDQVDRFLDEGSVDARMKRLEWLHETAKILPTFLSVALAVRRSQMMDDEIVRLTSNLATSAGSLGDKILSARINYLKPSTSYDESIKKRNEWCQFLASVGLSPRKISASESSTLIKNGEFVLPAGCWEVTGKEEFKIQVPSIRFSSDSLLISHGNSISLVGTRVYGGQMDLSPDQVQQVPSRALESDDRNAVVVPVVAALSILSKDNNNTVKTECNHTPPERGANGAILKPGRIATGVDGVGENAQFCPGEHWVVMQIPLRMPSPAPEQTERPQPSPSGGNLILVHDLEKIVNPVFRSFGAPAHPGFEGLKGGKGAESHRLVVKRDAKTNQESLEVWIANQIFPQSQPNVIRNIYIHSDLEMRTLFALYKQASPSGKSGQIGSFRIDPSFLSLLHPLDIQQLTKFCGEPLEEKVVECISKESQGLNLFLIQVLRLERMNFDPKASGMNIQEAELLKLFDSNPRRIFSAFEPLKLKGYEVGTQGPAGPKGSDGLLEIAP